MHFKKRYIFGLKKKIKRAGYVRCLLASLIHASKFRSPAVQNLFIISSVQLFLLSFFGPSGFAFVLLTQQTLLLQKYTVNHKWTQKFPKRKQKTICKRRCVHKMRSTMHTQYLSKTKPCTKGNLILYIFFFLSKNCVRSIGHLHT